MESGSLNHAMIDDAEAQAALAYAERFGEPGFDDPARLYIGQRYEGYTEENQRTWRALFDRQMPFLGEHASRVWVEGARTIALARDRVPELTAVNARLEGVTAWRSRPVPGYLPPKAFFACLARREFPTTIVLRPRDRIGYLPEPDVFHDVFGHVPLHADAAFAEFLQVWGEQALRSDDPAVTTGLARLFWFTVEFGLIREQGELRLYGSGLISSPGEAHHALAAAEVERRAFDLEEILDQPFEIDRYQPLLYVLDGFDQLRDAMLCYAKRIR